MGNREKPPENNFIKQPEVASPEGAIQRSEFFNSLTASLRRAGGSAEDIVNALNDNEKAKKIAGLILEAVGKEVGPGGERRKIKSLAESTRKDYVPRDKAYERESEVLFYYGELGILATQFGGARGDLEAAVAIGGQNLAKRIADVIREPAGK